jgi:hypothetical protein
MPYSPPRAESWHMYSLDAKDGYIVLEFYMLPKGDADRARSAGAISAGRFVECLEKQLWLSHNRRSHVDS